MIEVGISILVLCVKCFIVIEFCLLKKNICVLLKSMYKKKELIYIF